ncbi:Cytosolic Fe-S cluster assembly factor nar1 [Pseudocyphellaria aurata]|nr:Cytosolic Fe-S cluster assembly factor nar1 [Pseudocyphellaria aurata]
MSAILSADDLNDFISPGVACIKPVETLPLRKPEDSSNPYEVTTEDQLAAEKALPAQISLTDCLACSGCVTSAEAVLVSLQSHSEVLNTLDSKPSLNLSHLWYPPTGDAPECLPDGSARENHIGIRVDEGTVFVASVSPQVRASLAATYNVSHVEAGWMIDQLLGGPQGLASGGKYGNKFTWIVDTNAMRETSLVLGADEVMESLQLTDVSQPLGHQGDLGVQPKKPILSSACPGWICYAEKTHPHVLPHLSRLKSPQALTGILLKTVLSGRLRIQPEQIWHVAIMPCFDKKLEASREELTDVHWRSSSDTDPRSPVRDVDCVITARELLMLADSRGINFPALPREPLPFSSSIPFPDPILSSFLFPDLHLDRQNIKSISRPGRFQQTPATGTSGGYLHYILVSQQALCPGSVLQTTRGRNADVIEYTLERDNATLFKAARYYGFRNIQNLVRKLKPARKSRLLGARGGSGGRQASNANSTGLDYAYVEVMACPGGCTNGGGQIKVGDMDADIKSGALGQKEWLAKVDEAYFSMEEEGSDSEEAREPNAQQQQRQQHPPFSDSINGISPTHIRSVLAHWVRLVDIPLDSLVRTSYRVVVSDVGKEGPAGQTDRVAELAGRIGGGW